MIRTDWEQILDHLRNQGFVIKNHSEASGLITVLVPGVATTSPGTETER